MIWMKYFRTIWRSLSRISKKRWVSGRMIRGLPHRLKPPAINILSRMNNGTKEKLFLNLNIYIPLCVWPFMAARWKINHFIIGKLKLFLIQFLLHYFSFLYRVVVKVTVSFFWHYLQVSCTLALSIFDISLETCLASQLSGLWWDPRNPSDLSGASGTIRRDKLSLNIIRFYFKEKDFHETQSEKILYSLFSIKKCLTYWSCPGSRPG